MPPLREPSLRELQLRMMDALLGDASEPAVPFIAAPARRARRRLAVYRNTVQLNFLGSLESSFPAIRRLVGEEYFTQTAREFQRHHPSPSGDLLHAGRLFPDFLAELHAADRFRYLADVARLEWLIQDALLAAEHAPLDLSKLAAVSADDYDGLHFALHPSLRLFSAPVPALRIWDTNVGAAAAAGTEPETVDLDGGADRLALMCRRLTLEVHPLSPGEAGFLGAVQQGATFADAVDAGSAAGEEFDATAALRRFVTAEAIVDFS